MTVALEPPLLQVDGLTLSFSGVFPLRDVSFDVAKGGITAIIGPNGAGKTSLFNCISGLYRGSGRMTLGGERIEDERPETRHRRGIARTFQTPRLIEDASVFDNVLLGTHAWTKGGVVGSTLRPRRVGRDERRARDEVRALLETFELGDIAGRGVAGLPHRQRRLVEISRAMASRPTLLLLDEPAAGSHHSEAVAMLGTVAGVAADLGTTVLLVEHNVALVVRFAPRIVVLDFGQVIAQGSPAEIQADPKVITAYLGQGVV